MQNYAAPNDALIEATTGEYQELEGLMRVPLRSYRSFMSENGVCDIESGSQGFPEKTDFGVVVPVSTSGNYAKRFLYALRYTIKIRRLKNMRARNFSATRSYGVYPSIKNPSIVFQLGSPAESYANRLVLPSTAKGAIGVLRSALTVVTGFHPSVAGIVVLCRSCKAKVNVT